VAIIGVDIFLHGQCLHNFSVFTGRKGAAHPENRRRTLIKLGPKRNRKSESDVGGLHHLEGRLSFFKAITYNYDVYLNDPELVPLQNRGFSGV
jgi:hypothetical protein